MASSGPNYPGTVVNDIGIGTRAWSNATNVGASDNTYATAFHLAGGTTQYLKATNFGFSIPSGATIDGIEVTIEAATYAGSTRDSTVSLVKGGTISGSNLGTNTSWTTSDSIRTYGGPSQLWGLSWTDTDINASTFGVAYSSVMAGGKSGGGNRCDAMTITVYYTASGGGTTDAISLLLAGD